MLYDAEGRVVSVLELDVAGGVVQAMHAVVNPDKLGHLGPVSEWRDGRTGRASPESGQPAAVRDTRPARSHPCRRLC